MKQLISNWVLAVTALVLFIVLFPIGMLYSIYRTINKSTSITEGISKTLFNLALGIDQLGNSYCYLLFNDIFIKDNTIHPFGNPDETISSVLGRNKLINNLSFIGKILDGILSLIDDNHTIKSIGK